MSCLQRHILCLKELTLFEGLSQEEFDSICPGVINRSVVKGEFLFHQGGYNDAVYLVKCGRFKLTQIKEDGRETIINIVGPGEVLGETSLFQEEEQIFSAVAIENARLCGFRRGDLEKVIESNPSFAVKIVCHLAHKLNLALQQVSDSKSASVKERLLKVLMHLANEHGVIMADRTIIQIYITQQELGHMIGASRVKVSQVLKELRDVGIIHKQGKYYSIKTDFCMQRIGDKDTDTLSSLMSL